MVMLSTSIQFSAQAPEKKLEKKNHENQPKNLVNGEFEQLITKDVSIHHDNAITDNNHHGVSIAVIESLNDGEIIIKLISTGIILVADSMIRVSDSNIGKQCAIMFKQGHAEQPIIMGLLMDDVSLMNTESKNGIDNQNFEDIAHVTDHHDLLEKNQEDEMQGAEEVESEIPDVLHIQAKEQILMQCGDAVLYMDASGHVEIRSTRMISHSSGLNRIKGASVKIN